MNADYTSASDVVKIEISTQAIVETYEVGLGPTSLALSGDDVYVARTFYDENWISFYGSSKISGDDILIKDYGLGVACGGNIMKYKNEIYRSFDGGIALLENNLDIRSSSRIGSYDQSQVYSTKIIGDYIYFGILDSTTTTDQVKIVNENGDEVASYNVGIFPGDFSVWKN